MASAMMASRIRHSTRNYQTMCLPWRQKVLISSPLQRLPKTSFQPSYSVPFRNWTGGNTGKTFNIYTCFLFGNDDPNFCEERGGILCYHPYFVQCICFPRTCHIFFSRTCFTSNNDQSGIFILLFINAKKDTMDDYYSWNHFMSEERVSVLLLRPKEISDDTAHFKTMSSVLFSLLETTHNFTLSNVDAHSLLWWEFIKAHFTASLVTKHYYDMVHS